MIFDAHAGYHQKKEQLELIHQNKINQHILQQVSEKARRMYLVRSNSPTGVQNIFETRGTAYSRLGLAPTHCHHQLPAQSGQWWGSFNGQMNYSSKTGAHQKWNFPQQNYKPLLLSFGGTHQLRYTVPASVVSVGFGTKAWKQSLFKGDSFLLLIICKDATLSTLFLQGTNLNLTSSSFSSTLLAKQLSRCQHHARPSWGFILRVSPLLSVAYEGHHVELKICIREKSN